MELSSPGARLPGPEHARRSLVKAAILVILLAMGSCYALLREMTTMRLETYKPVEVVERGRKEELEDRCAEFALREVTICMEWFTYDDDTTHRAPYKLLIAASRPAAGLRSVVVEEIALTSSLARRHLFADTLRWPLAVPLGGTSVLLLEPALRLDYRAKEEISTRIRLRIVTASGARRVVLRTRWVPVQVESFTPIV